MLTKLMSIVLSIALIGTLTPSWAGESTAQTRPEAAVAPPSAAAVEDGLSMLLAKNLVSRGQVALSPAAMPRYRFDDPSQAAGQSSGSGTWTRGGKIMTVIGAALAGTGAVMVAKGGQSDEIGDSGMAVDWRATGYLWIAGGSVLAIIGLTRREK